MTNIQSQGTEVVLHSDGKPSAQPPSYLKQGGEFTLFPCQLINRNETVAEGDEWEVVTAPSAVPPKEW